MALLDKVRQTLSNIGQKIDQNPTRTGVQLLPPVSFKKLNIQPVTKAIQSYQARPSNQIAKTIGSAVRPALEATGTFGNLAYQSIFNQPKLNRQMAVDTQKALDASNRALQAAKAAREAGRPDLAAQYTRSMIPQLQAQSNKFTQSAKEAEAKRGALISSGTRTALYTSAAARLPASIGAGAVGAGLNATIGKQTSPDQIARSFGESFKYGGFPNLAFKGGLLARSLAGGAQNLAEDVAYAKLVEGRNLTPREAIISAATPGAFEAIGQFSRQVRKSVPKEVVEKVDPSGLMYNKAGQLFNPINGRWAKNTKEARLAAKNTKDFIASGGVPVKAGTRLVKLSDGKWVDESLIDQYKSEIDTPKLSVEPTPEQARANFQRQWQDAYGNRPATEKIDRPKRVIQAEKGATIDEMLRVEKEVNKSGKYFTNMGKVYDNATNRVIFDPSGKTTDEVVAFYKTLLSGENVPLNIGRSTPATKSLDYSKNPEYQKVESLSQPNYTKPLSVEPVGGEDVWYRGGNGKSGERDATFWTKDKATAEEFAKKTGGTVQEATPQLKNPLQTNDRFTLFEKIYGKQKAQDIIIDGNYSKYPDAKKIYESMKDNFDESLLEEKLIFPELRKRGYDGVILKQGQYDQPELMQLSPSPLGGKVGEVSSQLAANSQNLSQLPSTKPETLKQLQQQAQTNVKTDSLSSPRVYTAEASPETMKKITMRQARDQKIQANKEYKEYQRAVFSQEGARYTDKGNLTNQLKNIEKSIKSSTTPGGVKVEELKDISGFKSYTRDVYRNFKEVYGKNYENIKRTLLDPFDKSKGDLTRAYKNWSDRISNEVEKGLQIKKGSKESAAVQLYGEGKMTEPELVSQFGAKKTEQIKKADQWFRKEYDKLLDEVNATMKRIYPNNPEKQIPKRADYYRHFTEMGQGISGLRNIFDNPSNISSSLAGTSEFTKPKSKWLSFAQKRLGDRSEVDAVGGFLDYIKAAEYNKNIDPHTAKFRALAEDLAMQTEKDPKLNNFIEYLNDFSGDLAGKTNPGDRFIQKVIPGGRKTMSVINWVNNRIKANVILGNASSTIAQIFNVPQGIADVGPQYATKGLGSSIANIFGEKTPISKSNFITERYGGNAFDRFDRGLVNNGRKFAAWMTGVLDEVGTKYIWNAQYQKALGEGVQDAVKFADDRTRALVAGRGIGEVPLIQKSKVFQLVAPFQLEVANLWHVMGDWVGEKKFGKLVTFMLASYAFNRGAEAIRGSDVSFDPIQASIEAYNAYSEEEDKKLGAMKAGGRIGGEILSNVPLGQSIAASYPEYGAKIGDTQLPTREEFFGKGDPTRFGSGLLLTKGIQDPLFKLIPPYGGQQLKRTIEGATATEKGYSETKTGRVRFPTEDTPIRNLQRAVFGEYSTPNAREYFDSNTSTLGEKQSETFKKLPKDKAKSYYNQIIENRKKDKIREQEKTKEGLVKKVGAAEEAPQEITYTRASDNSSQTIKLSDLQKPTGTSLKDYLSSGNRESTIREIYKGYATGAIKEADMQSAFKTAGITVKEAEDMVIKELPLAQKSSLVYDRLVSPTSTTKDLDNMVESKLLTTNVITELTDSGKITEEQSKALKNYLKQKSGKVSKGKKPKKFKPTKFKAIKLKGAKKTYLKQKKLTLKDLLRK